MVSVFSTLAEVADKEFSVATLWLVAAAIAVASFALCRWRRWAAFIVLPVAAIWLWLLLSEIHERFVGPAILQELGHGYVIQTYVSAVLPLLFITLGLIWKRRQTI
ncbi:MAG: hypothetical protein ACJ8KF_07350 [Chthoniobacterales bacterium]